MGNWGQTPLIARFKKWSVPYFTPYFKYWYQYEKKLFGSMGKSTEATMKHEDLRTIMGETLLHELAFNRSGNRAIVTPPGMIASRGRAF